MKSKIISGFPGMGKSYFHGNSEYKTTDSDSSLFSWVKDDNGVNTNIRNPEFPGNYIKHIIDCIGKYDYIFISSHKEVREAMQDACLYFYLVYPGINRKEEFIKRYSDRGNPEMFIKLVENNWESWIRECANEKKCRRMVMVEGNLSDAIGFIDKDKDSYR